MPLLSLYLYVLENTVILLKIGFYVTYNGLVIFNELINVTFVLVPYTVNFI